MHRLCRFLVVGALALLATPAAAQQVIRTGDIIQCSGTVAAGGASQVATPGDAARAWLVIENPITATEPLMVNFGPSNAASTASGSMEIAAGGSLSFVSGVVPNGQVNVTAATTGHRFVCMAGR